MRIAVLVSVLAAAGCGDDGHATPTDAAIDTAADAGTDAPVGVSYLIVNNGAAGITQWAAPDTYVGTSSSARLFVLNPALVATPSLALSLAGANAAEFAIVPTGSTCGATLAAGDGCWITLRFSPASTGAKAATLHVAAGALSSDVPLTGTALALPTSGLASDTAVIDFGVVQHAQTSTAHVIISNPSSATIALGARSATAPYFVASDNCPATLTPGGACTVNVFYDGNTLGLATGTLHVAGASDPAVPIRSITLRHIVINGGSGSGTGRITSMPSGIDSPNVSSGGNFPLGIDITLTATPNGTDVFGDWSGLCSGTTPTCVIMSPGDGGVSARFFSAAAKKITVTFAGTSGGVAFAGGTTCRSSCTLMVDPGTQLTISGYSPSTFVSWSGDCTGPGPDCNLGTVVADRAVTMTTAAVMYEAAMLMPTSATRGLAVAANGDLVIATAGGVSRTTLSGSVVWSTALTGGATSIAVDTSGRVYGRGNGGVFALGANGAVTWTLGFSGAPTAFSLMNGSVATKPDGTVVAFLTADGVHVVDGTGADRFVITGVSPAPQAVAVDSSGIVGLIQKVSPMAVDQVQVLRYSATGTALATLGPIPAQPRGVIAYAPSGDACVAETGSGVNYVSCTTSTNTTPWSDRIDDGAATSIRLGIGVGANGDVAMLRDSGSGLYNMKLRLYSSTGTLLWNYTNPVPAQFSPPHSQALRPDTVGMGGVNRFAVAGTLDNGAVPFIQVFDLP